MYRIGIGKDKMNMLIVPYDGESAELTLALKRYNVDVPKKECKNGTCPIPKPLKMMSASEVKNRILNTLKIGATNVKQIVVLALNEKDQNILVEMSRVGDWGNVKKGVTVKIISVV
jgi:hypothetical protein